MVVQLVRLSFSRPCGGFVRGALCVLVRAPAHAAMRAILGCWSLSSLARVHGHAWAADGLTTVGAVISDTALAWTPVRGGYPTQPPRRNGLQVLCVSDSCRGCHDAVP